MICEKSQQLVLIFDCLNYFRLQKDFFFFLFHWLKQLCKITTKFLNFNVKILSDLFYLFAYFIQTLLYFGLSFQPQMKFPDKLAVNQGIIGSFFYNIDKVSFQLC